MKKNVHKSFFYLLLQFAAVLISLTAFGQGGGNGNGSGPGDPLVVPELIFKNPVLKSGQPFKQNAVYRFSNVAAGVDAEIKLKKFSRPDIKMTHIDNPSIGWDKAFQPEFGIQGYIAPNQNWYIDFELTFYKAGQNQKQKLAKVVLTTLDVDGDGHSVAEYAVVNNAHNVIYSSISYLQGLTNAAGNLGQQLICSQCGLLGILAGCNLCGADGLDNNGDDCTKCDGSGKMHALCQHGYMQTTVVQGPIDNFLNIDTLATQVMATYEYINKDRITFRYGARSGSQSSYGSGIRMNSMWFKSFDLTPAVTLPVKLSDFTARLDKKNVNLRWSATEADFSHYVLQRSDNGKEFSDIAIIFPTGGTNLNEYEYKDANAVSSTGMLFYRLQMVDKTKETARLSEVRTIRLSGDQNEIQITTYPNPVTDQLRITIPASWQGKAVLFELFTSNGSRVQNIQTGSASQTETMQVGELSKGFYLVKASCDDQVARQRVIKN